MLQILKKFKVMAQKRAEKLLEILISNEGGEYTLRELESLYDDIWVLYEINEPNTHQHNVLAKRMHVTTVCMLKENNLPHDFWSEYVQTLCYVLNKSSTKILDMFLGQITLHLLRTWGFFALYLSNTQRPKKEKAYRLLNWRFIHFFTILWPRRLL